MKTRIVLGLALIGVLAAVLAVDRSTGHGWIVATLAGLCALAGLREARRLLPSIRVISEIVVAAGVLALIVTVQVAGQPGAAWPAGVVACVLATLAVLALRGPAPDQGVDEICTGWFLFGYLGVFPATVVMIRQGPEGWKLVVALLVCTKAADTGAYFTGRWLGRHPWVPRLSPRKTWEGLAGGLTLAGFMGWWLLGPVMSVVAFGWAEAILFGLVAGFAGALGDLVESLLKRARGIKDAGAVLPEYGGVLDLIDSPLIAAPAVWLFVTVLGS